jgi:hypothetical protein
MMAVATKGKEWDHFETLLLLSDSWPIKNLTINHPFYFLAQTSSENIYDVYQILIRLMSCAENGHYNTLKKIIISAIHHSDLINLLNRCSPSDLEVAFSLGDILSNKKLVTHILQADDTLKCNNTSELSSLSSILDIFRKTPQYFNFANFALNLNSSDLLRMMINATRLMPHYINSVNIAKNVIKSLDFIAMNWLLDQEMVDFFLKYEKENPHNMLSYLAALPPLYTTGILTLNEKSLSSALKLGNFLFTLAQYHRSIKIENPVEIERLTLLPLSDLQLDGFYKLKFILQHIELFKSKSEYLSSEWFLKCCNPRSLPKLTIPNYTQDQIIELFELSVPSNYHYLNKLLVKCAKYFVSYDKLVAIVKDKKLFIQLADLVNAGLILQKLEINNIKKLRISVGYNGSLLHSLGNAVPESILNIFLAETTDPDTLLSKILSNIGLLMLARKSYALPSLKIKFLLELLNDYSLNEINLLASIEIYQTTPRLTTFFNADYLRYTTIYNPPKTFFDSVCMASISASFLKKNKESIGKVINVLLKAYDQRFFADFLKKGSFEWLVAQGDQLSQLYLEHDNQSSRLLQVTSNESSSSVFHDHNYIISLLARKLKDNLPPSANVNKPTYVLHFNGRSEQLTNDEIPQNLTHDQRIDLIEGFAKRLSNKLPKKETPTQYIFVAENPVESDTLKK